MRTTLSTAKSVPLPCTAATMPITAQRLPPLPEASFAPPRMAKPEFNANTISENDIPADFLNGKAEETVQPAQPVQQPRQSAVQSGPVCPKCGARLIEGQRFCNSCGARIGDAVSAAASIRRFFRLVRFHIPPPSSHPRAA